jgi:hypothetical protein
LETSKIIILIPSRNELKTLKSICFFIKKLKIELLVVDDYSSDETSSWLSLNKINCIRNNNRLGYTGSLLRGFKYIFRNYKKEYVITFDGDGEHKVEDLTKIIRKIRNDDDLIICSRKKYNRWPEYILSFFFYIKYRIYDPLSGLKIISVSRLKNIFINLDKNNFLIDIIPLFKKKGFKIRNFKISVNSRKDNSRIGSSFLISIKILKTFKYIFY